jgi:hypothetical protein
MLSPYSGNSAVDSTCLGQWTPVEDLRFGFGESGTYKLMLCSEWLEVLTEGSQWTLLVQSVPCLQMERARGRPGVVFVRKTGRQRRDLG